MPRPFKSRSVMEEPVCCKFNPEKTSEQGSVILSLDEYEVIRKCDYERLSQENCATVMKISRTTVQRIYASARVKIAQALVLGKVLEIEGGPVNIIEQSSLGYISSNHETGENKLKIAIGLNGQNVADHFGHCNDFRIVEIENGVVVHQEELFDDVHVHQERPQFLKDKGVDVLIMKTMGKGAYNRLVALNIQCIDAQDKTVEEALQAYLNKTLTSPLEAGDCAGCGDHDHEHKHHHEGHHHG
jgi:predicted DNA-binding protein (UPF0251 family)/predicted Fe-Mo cluster-binding NifX family protein